MTRQHVQFGNPAALNCESVEIPENAPLKDKVIAALHNVYDPEIPLNLYDLGLIYNIEIGEHNTVHIKMTLTTPHCPVAESMPGQVECAVREIKEVTDVKVKLVWDPPWDKDCMSDEARLTLGLY
ncbi:MAG: SUF system Fe-S cluster assembly protein [Halobacteria archaeon]|nr:SUF system Fe-S cluster assembly protein [Halobacteria archaeon]